MRNAPLLAADKALLLRKFFRRSYFRIRNVTRAISESAQELVWNHSIRPKDAIHVATALSDGIAVLETFDQLLIDRSGKVGSPPLQIRKPLAAKQPRLFR